MAASHVDPGSSSPRHQSATSSELPILPAGGELLRGGERLEILATGRRPFVEHQRFYPGLGQRNRCSQARGAGADDDDFRLLDLRGGRVSALPECR